MKNKHLFCYKPTFAGFQITYTSDNYDSINIVIHALEHIHLYCVCIN